MSPGPARPAPSPTSRSNRCWSPPWRPPPRTPPTGRPGPGPPAGHVAVGHQPDLAGLRAQAAPGRHLQAVHRPAVHREGPRRGRPVPQPPQAAWCCAWTRRRRCRRWTAPPRSCRCCPGPAAATHDYVRHGTTNLYAALDVASGKVLSQLTAATARWSSGGSWPASTSRCPPSWTVHVICDNSSTHKTPAIQRWLLAHPRFHLHFTPTYSSWLNLVERWFAELTSKWLRRGTHRSVAELEQRSRPGSTPGTRTRGRLCGPRPPTRSSTPSPPTANESTTQHQTAGRGRAGKALNQGRLVGWDGLVLAG